MPDSSKATPDLLRPFKVGDKVCDPILQANGEVVNIWNSGIYTVGVDFMDGQRHDYTQTGLYHISNKVSRLFHGHMVEGTGTLTFAPKKEPVYEWQWEFVGVTTDQREKIWTTNFYKSEKEMLDFCAHPTRKDFIRIERSKREVIN